MKPVMWGHKQTFALYYRVMRQMAQLEMYESLSDEAKLMI